jgi:hypothetical protein
MEATSRDTLPKASDRLKLGTSGLSVSPVCLGIAGSAETVVAAFDTGINFFFVSGDLHWPQYEGLRSGLAELLSRGPSVRDEIVVGVVSYLEEPLFHYLQFHEVIDSIPGLKRVDLLIAGAVASPESFKSRLVSLREARLAAHKGSRAIGATFHHRGCALLSLNYDCLDIHYIRYNTAHRRAVEDFFPHVPPERASLIFSFKSTFPLVAEERVRQFGLDGGSWLPKVTDYYRFALTHRQLDGVLCRLSSPREVEELVEALEEKPLTPDELAHMIRLSSGSAARMPEKA